MGLVARFFLLVVILTFGEFYLLMEVAGATSVFTTLLLCVLTGILGGALVRAQGLRTLLEIQKALGQGRVPAVEIVSGLILLMIGTMLLTPGFITDTLAFLMLIPSLRKVVAAVVMGWMKNKAQFKVMNMGGMGATTGSTGASNFSYRRPEDVVIDVEAEDVR